MVEVALEVAIDACDEREASDVELAILIEQGLFAVFLDYVRPLDMRIRHNRLDLGYVAANCDSTASVRVLTRLDDPQVLAHAWVLGQVLLILRRVVCLFKLVELWV